MKIQKNKIYTFGITSIAIFLSIILWNTFHISYHTNGIIGDYSINNYNSLNDPIKYLIFILFPAFIFFICNIIFEKKNINSFILFSRYEKNLEDENDLILNIIFFILFLLILLEFFSLDFSYHKLDIFHSGQRLNAAFKSLLDNSLWSGSYITSGIFIEIINAKLIWKLFDFQSIGLVRFSETLLILISKFLLIILSYKITKIIFLKKNLKTLFFVILSCIFLNLIDYDINSADLIESREIPNLILLILTLNYVNVDNNKFKLSFILLGLLSVLSFFWSIDRAIIYNFFMVSIFIYFAVNKNFKGIGYILSVIIVCWILIFFLLQKEFSIFISNTVSVLKEFSDIHGIIHPSLFSDEPNSSRATKTLSVILFSVLFSINLIFKNKSNDKNKKTKIFLIFLSVLSFLSYIYAIGRSDGGHIRQAFGYPLIFLMLLILLNIFQLLNKINPNSIIKHVKYFNLVLIPFYSYI